jgi:hypothetical protein
MDMNVIKDRTQEIKQELSELNNTLKMSVHKAIRIGELLTEQKEIVGHGLFIQWIESNLDISRYTAINYMKLYEYKDKCGNVQHLQEAYKQIETIEAQSKQTKEERDRAMIAEYRKTGKKPIGWTRELDYRIKKDAEAESKQKERIEKEKQERERRAKEHKEQQVSFQHNQSSNILTDAFQTVAGAFIEKTNKRNEWKEKIRLSESGKESAFMDAIIDYLETLPDDNRRIEACYNIVKICKNIAVKLQNSNLGKVA